MPVGGEPTAVENGALAGALEAYGKRTSQDDFGALEQFVAAHPQSAWRASVLTGLGLEYYNTAHYSKALAAWQAAWALGKNATDLKGKAIADRAVGELAFMYGRLGRMTELEALLKSIAERELTGPATERIAGVREALWTMQHRPEIAFRCGPQALLRIQKVLLPEKPADMTIFNSASTTNGMSLPQVAELSQKVGLNYQMAFREKHADFSVPSVVHWKVGHYAALVRQEGDKYLLEDPTFGNTVWATRAALEAETSGYFLISRGALPKGWRAVDRQEGEQVWGKGSISINDPKRTTPGDQATPQCSGGGGGGGAFPSPFPNTAMAASRVHLMLVNLNLVDTPVGYSPPVGPGVGFTVRYNHREPNQPGVFSYANLGAKWTCDWISYITDNPQNPLADVNHYVRGGGASVFSGFNTNSQSFGYEQYDQNRLTRTGNSPISYEMLGRNGAKMVFAQSDGSIGTTRKIFLTQVVDPFGNTVTLNYDGNLRITNIVDAIGQATTLAYSTNDIYKIVRVTDPFGRFASFDYDHLGRLTNITDVIGMSSRFVYEGSGDYVNALITPYGTNSFTRGESGTTRWLETLYPDGSRDRVEFNQSTTLAMPYAESPAAVPQGMSTGNNFLWFRNTYYWSRTACASSYGDYSKAKVYHWLHTEDVTKCSGILESLKEPLEGRVWYDYGGQSDPIFVGTNNRPTHVGRVLDDGSTQLYTYAYNGFGNVTKTIDPVGRTFSYIYDTNGIDLLEVRMTRAGKNELLSKTTYNAQHLPLTAAGANGLFTTNTYNARGQLLTTTNPKGETTTYTYNTNGYLIAVDGPLPGTNDTIFATYDGFGRTQTKTDDSGYTVVFDRDALDRLTKVTFPDGTYDQITYDRLDAHIIQDRAGRQTVLGYDGLRNLISRTDPLGRISRFQWCNCGNVKSLTDPMGRTTEWETDVQGRLRAKHFGDGSQITYNYENRSGRLRQVIEEKLQVKQFVYNSDNTLRSINYPNAVVPTPPVAFTYDPDYRRLAGMVDRTGSTLYSYQPITANPDRSAGRLVGIDGPLANDTITYEYDALGRPAHTAIAGVAIGTSYDAASRISVETNVLGAFSRAYDGSSRRLLAEISPIGLTATNGYDGTIGDHLLTNITYAVGGGPVSAFGLERDAGAGRIRTWSQKIGTSAPDLYTFGYDAADRLVGAVITNSGAMINWFTYAYDDADNRLVEVDGPTTNLATFNALNQYNTSTTSSTSARTNEWDAENRLVAINAGDERTEFTYDGFSHLASIRRLTNNVEASFRRFVWTDNQIAEERDAAGLVTKRFYRQGTKIESGPNAGLYYFTRDHLRSIREVVDMAGNVRARYRYDPFGRRIQVGGDLASDFGFAGMFWSSEAGLYLTRFRAYDASLGRWLSRDPLPRAEQREGPNLYAYVRNNPVNAIDPLGLCCEKELNDYTLAQLPGLNPGLSPECQMWKTAAYAACNGVLGRNDPQCAAAELNSMINCELPLRKRWIDCVSQPCKAPPCKVGFGSGNFGDGLPPAGEPLGEGYSEIETPGYEPPATASTGRPAERMAAETTATALLPKP